MKRFVYLSVAIVAVVLIWTAGWFYISNEVKKGVTSLAEADGVTSPRLTCQSLSVTGFPFRFDIDCIEVTLIQADVAATLPELRASVLVYRPTHAIISAKAPLTVADAFTGSQQRIDWTALEASVRLNGWRLARASVHAENPAISDTVFGDRLIAKASTLEAHLLDIPEQHDAERGIAALAVFSTAEGVEAPVLEIADGRVSLEAEATGVPDDVRELSAPDALVRWQQAGGKLQLVSLRGDADENFFESSGTLGLDDAAQVEGQVKLSSRGVIERTGDLFPPDWKPLIIGSQAEDGSYSQLINIRGGTIFSGLIPIASIPPLF